MIGTPLHDATIDQRIMAFGLNPHTVRQIAQVAAQDLRRLHYPADGLVLLAQAEKPRRVDDANGNCLWAVIRNYRLVTVLLRRDSQPALNGLPTYDASQAARQGD
jgi:hypothetical protein